jgi:hypothetical protein
MPNVRRIAATVQRLEGAQADIQQSIQQSVKSEVIFLNRIN